MIIFGCSYDFRGTAINEDMQPTRCSYCNMFREHHGTGVVYNETAMLSRTFETIIIQKFNYTSSGLRNKTVSLTGEKFD